MLSLMISSSSRKEKTFLTKTTEIYIERNWKNKQKEKKKKLKVEKKKRKEMNSCKRKEKKKTK